MHHSLQLNAILDPAGAARVTAALRTLGGVDGVNATAGTNHVAVVYDDARTSPQEIETVSAQAGFPVRRRAHGSGGCCGGCGGH
ncbi:MAG: heavy-metal-associated domain-containing protein [Telluria sp.]